MDEDGEAVLCLREGRERRHTGGVLVGQQAGKLATQRPAGSPLVSGPLDDIEYLFEHGALARLPRRDHRYDAAEAGGHSFARTYPAAVLIQAGHRAPTPWPSFVGRRAENIAVVGALVGRHSPA